ncbi:hypothetical protein BD413DRAFT_680567 [Trametes elegans]|nr:hypothetical protein BD413DRAFT_680567 [Trametes elegans]
MAFLFDSLFTNLRRDIAPNDPWSFAQTNARSDIEDGTIHQYLLHGPDFQLPKECEPPLPKTSDMTILDSLPSPLLSSYPFTFAYSLPTSTSTTPISTPTERCISPTRIFPAPLDINNESLQSDCESEDGMDMEEGPSSQGDHILVDVVGGLDPQTRMSTGSPGHREAKNSLKQASPSIDSEAERELVKENQETTPTSPSAPPPRKRRRGDEVRKLLNLPGGKTGTTCGMDRGECKHTISGDPKDAKKHFNTTHKDRSNGERFRCTIGQCDRSYARKGDLLKHVISGHWKWAYVCKVANCRKRFGRVDLLSRHTETHHES